MSLSSFFTLFSKWCLCGKYRLYRAFQKKVAQANTDCGTNFNQILFLFSDICNLHLEFLKYVHNLFVNPIATFVDDSENTRQFGDLSFDKMLSAKRTYFRKVNFETSSI